MGGADVGLHAVLTSPPDTGEWPASVYCRSAAGERSPFITVQGAGRATEKGTHNFRLLSHVRTKISDQ